MTKCLNSRQIDTKQDYEIMTSELGHQMLCYKKTASKNGYVKVSSKLLEKLVNNIIQLKHSLKKVLAVNKISLLCKRIYILEQEIARKSNELAYLKTKWNHLLQNAEKYREENFQLKHAMKVMNEDRSEEYAECMSFLSICLTLLWHVSLNDESISAMLTSKTTVKFLDFVLRSLDGFIESTKESTEAVENDSDEFTSVLAIGGIITNITATAMGREFLVSREDGVKLLDALIVFLSEIPAQRFGAIKNLIVKVIYNTSINGKGLKYLLSKKGLMTTLGLLLQEETDAKLRLSSVSCIQSLLLEPESASLAHEVLEVVSVKKLQEYAVLSKGDLKQATLELISDLTVFIQTQP